jgi:hypothetical protein
VPGITIARWTATWDRLATWAYTRNVTSLPKRLTSLAIVIALSGSPVVLSACMALCPQGMAIAASDTYSQSAHVTAAVPAGATAHAHHASPVSNESAATGPATASCHDWSAAAPLRATCTHCCSEGQAILLAGLGVERTDATSFSATPIASWMASFLVTLRGLGASPPSPPVPPPSPTRALLILRI